MEVRNQVFFNLLNQNPNLPALIYFNHQTGDDPLVVASLLLNHTPKCNLVIMPTSHTYHQFFGPQPHYALAVKLAEGFLNWQMPSIIQAYRRREEENKKR